MKRELWTGALLVEWIFVSFTEKKNHRQVNLAGDIQN